MRVLRLLFISITLPLILLLFSNIGFSQSSLFNDAKELAVFLNTKNSISVHLKKSPTSKAILEITSENKKNTRSVKEKIDLSFGYYDVHVKNWEPTDTLNIVFPDTLISFGKNDTFLIKTTLRQEPRTAEILSITDQLSDEYFLITFLPGGIYLDVSYTVNLRTLVPMEYYGKENDLQLYYKVLKILNSHANFGLVDKGVDLSFQGTQFDYTLNPFVNNLNINNPLLSQDIDRYFPPSFFSESKMAFADDYYKNNPWSKLLYGDSVLQLQKTVSFEDASSSYRTRIVSSQKELTEASIRIDRTNKNKNLLDAKTVAVGLSDFIAERAQEELNLTFFNRFKQNMENPSELTVLFPSTKTLLYNFEISNYKTLLSHARESFTVDLDNLGLNFPKVLKLKKYEDLYNSPEVFNLSLIYSIADLAYKEVPVETILISGFQKLQERKSELKKSINIELADAFLTASNPNKTKDRKVIRSLVQKNPELDTLNQKVKNYLSALNNSRTTLENTTYSFSQNLTNYGELNFTNSIQKSEDQNIIINEIETNLLRINKSISKFQEKFTREIFYNNRRIKEDENTILNYYDNIISANLQGKEFYGYLIDNPRFEDYELYLKTETDSINGIIAKGLEESRNLMAENFDKEIFQFYKTVEESQELYKSQRVNYVLAGKEKNTKKKKVIEFAKKGRLLHLAIKKEIDFWKNTVPENEASFHLAGLYFLDALLSEDIYVRLFQRFAKDLEVKDIPIENLIKKHYSNSLDADFNKNLLAAETRLDSIQSDFVHKINALKNDFGGNTMISNSKQLQLLINNFEADTLRIAEKIQKEERFFLGNKFEIESIISDEELRDTLNIKLDESEIIYVGEFEYFNKLENLDSDLDDLQEELKDPSNASKRDSINNEIIKLNDEKEGLVERKEKELNQVVKVLEKEKEVKIKLLKAELNEVKSDFEIEKSTITSEANIAATTLIKDKYDVMNNIYYERLFYKNKDEEYIAYVKDFDLDGLDQELVETKKVVDELKSTSKQLKNHIAYLENKYCKDLIAAEKNAKNLSIGMEVATHLLFAFRDYEKIRDTLFYEDSVFIKVTINQLDSLSGFTNTYTSDSLRMIRKPIKGTTDELVAARWITKEEFQDLRKNELEYNIFLGLLYQRLTAIEDAPDFSPKGIAILATKFLSITNDMDTYRNELRRKKAIDGNSISFKDYYPFIRSTVDLFNTVITTPSIGDTTTVATSFGLKNIPVISNEALSLYENIYAKNYGNAILNSMQLLKIITKEKRAEKRSKKEKRVDNRENRKSQLAINAVLTYGTFMANMIKAESSDQIKNILKSATLPPGSSRIKRETVTSFTVNSYLGAAVGRDRLLGIPDNLDLAQDAFGASLAVPIGFTYSFSPNFIKNNSSFSIHVPLIDLGAITAYRQNPDNPNYSIDDLPDFSWNNLFSPGLFAVYNFAESPFSLGVGGQYGPQLRQITINTGEAINVNSWRFPMAFFTIDVPFFNLHTGARKIIVK